MSTTESASIYPAFRRTEWILAQRPPRQREPTLYRPHGVFLERERLVSGEVADSGVVLLASRECPWRCLMCDLWQGTTQSSMQPWAITRQIEHAVRTWSATPALPQQVKLYNSGSFFDPGAIRPTEYASIAQQVRFARNVVVESHPLLVGDRTRLLRDMLPGTLEVAMGLETAHPQVLERLNKRFTVAQFAQTAAYLAAERIGLRVFLLVHPPWLHGAAGLDWVVKSAEFAFDCGATAVTLIPTRNGNGAMDRLQAAGEFAPPTLAELEQAQSAVLAMGRGRVFADTWNLARISDCPRCLDARQARIERINLGQRHEPPLRCTHARATTPRENPESTG